MNFDFTAAIDTIRAQRGDFRAANEAIPGTAYRLAQYLPERPSVNYNVSNATMTIRTIMAGLVGMDSPYPPAGAAEMSTFKENTVKVANKLELPEAQLRELHQLLMTIGIDGGDTSAQVVDTALNFLDKVIVQGHLDTAEWMRGQALSTGALSWTFNNIALAVDYGIPSANILPVRTGNDGYGGSSSDFWADIKTARSKLNGQIRAMIMSQTTKEMILSQTANNIIITAENDLTGDFSIRRIVTLNGVPVPSSDAREQASFIVYNREGEVYDINNPGTTVKVPFFPDGVITCIGNPVGNRFVIGTGATTPPPSPSSPAIGYTHLAPTTEGGTPGRWARLYVPQERPWTFGGEGASNLLPVIDDPTRIVLLRTEIA